MTRPQLILPQADAACGKVFFADRRTADGHRIALEVWNQATGRTREGYRLAVFRCRRCGGFHVGQRPVNKTNTPPRMTPRKDFRRDDEPYQADDDPPRELRVARFAYPC